MAEPEDTHTDLVAAIPTMPDGRTIVRGLPLPTSEASSGALAQRAMDDEEFASLLRDVVDPSTIWGGLAATYSVAPLAAKYPELASYATMSELRQAIRQWNKWKGKRTSVPKTLGAPLNATPAPSPVSTRPTPTKLAAGLESSTAAPDSTPAPGPVSGDPYWSARGAVNETITPAPLTMAFDGATSSLLRKLAEIDTSLARIFVTDAEKVETLRNRKSVFVQIHPDALPITVRGGPGRGHRSGGLKAPNFAQHTAEVLGIGISTINGYVRAAEDIDKQAFDLLRAHRYPGGIGDLQELAKHKKFPARQVRAVRRIFCHAGSETAPTWMGNRANPKTSLMRMKDALAAEIWEESAASHGLIVTDGGHYQISNDDFVQFSRRIHDGTIALVLTDIHWDKADASLFVPFAQESARILVPGGWCVVQVGQERVEDMFHAFRKLGYDSKWIHGYDRQVGAKPSCGAVQCSDWLPVLAFRKSGNAKESVIPATDKFVEHGFDKKTIHRYQKSVFAFEDLVRAFSKPGDVVFDPFLGSGTTGVAALNTGRRFLGCDIDPGAMAIASPRLQGVEHWGCHLHPVEPDTKEGLRVQAFFSQQREAFFAAHEDHDEREAYDREDVGLDEMPNMVVEFSSWFEN